MSDYTNPYKRVPEMTLREHYAGLAMQALISQVPRTEVAKHALRLADRLINELNKKQMCDPDA